MGSVCGGSVSERVGASLPELVFHYNLLNLNYFCRTNVNFLVWLLLCYSPLYLMGVQSCCIQQVAVIPLPDKELGEQVGAIIACADKAPSLLGLCDLLIETGLATIKLPEQLYVLSRLPVTPIGKVDKKKYQSSTLVACFND